MFKAETTKHTLHFINPAGTSRGVLHEKETWYLRVYDCENPTQFGVGECALFKGLSLEDPAGYEAKLAEVCREINNLDRVDLTGWSSIIFGIESAISDLATGGQRTPFLSPFTRGEKGIEINGLVWMGSKEQMYQRIEEKLACGFGCIKLKIGAIDFESELSLLRAIRQRYSKDSIELRVDANGAFSPQEALQRLEALARYDIHSIEQPIAQGQWSDMAQLCSRTPIPIALDEELIGVYDLPQKVALLDEIKPQYLIFKPSLCGGFASTHEWIELCEAKSIGWWVTSALESNIGLNAIAQWVATLHTTMPQGLGTGLLYSNNIPSPLEQVGCELRYNPEKSWDLTNCCQ